MTLNGRSERRRAGFTLIEVMVSLVVLVVGSMALITLMQYGGRANAAARSMNIATEIADRWAARFKQDAQTWTQVGQLVGAPTAAQVLASTNWLRRVDVQPNVFQTITMPPGSLYSNAFNFYGDDIPGAGANSPVYYCASFRPNWVDYGRSIRIDIRVWWRKERNLTQRDTTIARDFIGCADNDTQLRPGQPLWDAYSIIYMPVTVNMTQVVN